MQDAEKFTSPANYVLDIDSNIVVVGSRDTVSRRLAGLIQCGTGRALLVVTRVSSGKSLCRRVVVNRILEYCFSYIGHRVFKATGSLRLYKALKYIKNLNNYNPYIPNDHSVTSIKKR